MAQKNTEAENLKEIEGIRKAREELLTEEIKEKIRSKDKTLAKDLSTTKTTWDNLKRKVTWKHIDVEKSITGQKQFLKRVREFIANDALEASSVAHAPVVRASSAAHAPVVRASIDYTAQIEELRLARLKILTEERIQKILTDDMYIDLRTDYSTTKKTWDNIKRPVSWDHMNVPDAIEGQKRFLARVEKRFTPSTFTTVVATSAPEVWGRSGPVAMVVPTVPMYESEEQKISPEEYRLFKLKNLINQKIKGVRIMKGSKLESLHKPHQIFSRLFSNIDTVYEPAFTVEKIDNVVMLKDVFVYTSPIISFGCKTEDMEFKAMFNSETFTSRLKQKFTFDPTYNILTLTLYGFDFAGKRFYFKSNYTITPDSIKFDPYIAPVASEEEETSAHTLFKQNNIVVLNIWKFINDNYILPDASSYRNFEILARELTAADIEKLKQPVTFVSSFRELERKLRHIEIYFFSQGTSRVRQISKEKIKNFNTAKKILKDLEHYDIDRLSNIYDDTVKLNRKDAVPAGEVQYMSPYAKHLLTLSRRYSSKFKKGENFGIYPPYLVSFMLEYNQKYSNYMSTYDRLCLTPSNIEKFCDFIHSFRAAAFDTVSLYYMMKRDTPRDIIDYYFCSVYPHTEWNQDELTFPIKTFNEIFYVSRGNRHDCYFVKDTREPKIPFVRLQVLEPLLGMFNGNPDIDYNFVHHKSNSLFFGSHVSELFHNTTQSDLFVVPVEEEFPSLQKANTLHLKEREEHAEKIRAAIKKEKEVPQSVGPFVLPPEPSYEPKNPSLVVKQDTVVSDYAADILGITVASEKKKAAQDEEIYESKVDELRPIFLEVMINEFKKYFEKQWRKHTLKPSVSMMKPTVKEPVKKQKKEEKQLSLDYRTPKTETKLQKRAREESERFEREERERMEHEEIVEVDTTGIDFTLYEDKADAYDAELDKAYNKAGEEFTSLINSIKERAHIEEIVKKIDRMLGKSHTPKELIENYTELKNAFIQAIKEVDIQHKKYSTTITKASADKIHKFAQKDEALGFVRKAAREAKGFFPELNDEKKYLRLKNLLNL